jgi:hypothetical protein
LSRPWLVAFLAIKYARTLLSTAQCFSALQRDWRGAFLWHCFEYQLRRTICLILVSQQATISKVRLSDTESPMAVMAVRAAHRDASRNPTESAGYTELRAATKLRAKTPLSTQF